MIGFHALHDLRRYTVPRCWAPHTQAQVCVRWLGAASAWRPAVWPRCQPTARSGPLFSASSVPAAPPRRPQPPQPLCTVPPLSEGGRLAGGGELLAVLARPGAVPLGSTLGPYPIGSPISGRGGRQT